MRKLSFIRIKRLFLAASARFYTDKAVPAMPKHRFEPRSAPFYPAADDCDDIWLFSPETELAAETETLAREFNGLSSALAGLRETLAVIHQIKPVQESEPSNTFGQNLLHDSALFDGEPQADILSQDTLVEGGGAFLFEDTPPASDTVQQAA